MMRFLSLAFAFPLMAQNFPIDHVTVAGRDLKAMTEALRSVTSLEAQNGGPHSNHATEMALASFPDGSYLELIAIQAKAGPAALAAHYWHKFLEADGGPCAWAIRPAAYVTEAERLREAGIAVTDWHRAGRKRPDGVELDWETAQVGPTNGGFFPFMIHDFTPREKRAFPSGKPTTTEFTGIEKVVIGVRDLAGAIERYRQAYLLPAPQRRTDAEFGADLAFFPLTHVVLAAPLSSDSWLGVRLEQFGDAPCAFVLGTERGQIMGGTIPSDWFGKIRWVDSAKLGWHLGIETQ
jgi:Glyoxalase-like domain